MQYVSKDTYPRAPLINAARNRLAMEQLLALLRTGQPYAMTGSGVSVWAGYRTWRQLIERLAGLSHNGAAPRSTQR